MTHIDSIEKVEKYEKKFYKVIGDGKTYRAFDNTVAFKQLEEKVYGLDSNVDFKFTTTSKGEYKYNNLEEFLPINSLPPATAAEADVPVPKKEVDSGKSKRLTYDEKKDILFVRQNAHRHADELAKIDAKVGGAPVDMGKYFRRAADIEANIWRGIKTKEELK